MEAKDQKPLSITDILDQLVKPSVTQTAEPPLPQQPKATPSQPQGGQGVGIRLPQLGQDKSADSSGGKSTTPQTAISGRPPELKLFIRTMADDIARIRSGQKPGGFEVKKASLPMPEIKKSPPPPAPPLPQPEKPQFRPVPPSPPSRSAPTPPPRPTPPPPLRPMSPPPLPRPTTSPPLTFTPLPPSSGKSSFLPSMRAPRPEAPPVPRKESAPPPTTALPDFSKYIKQEIHIDDDEERHEDELLPAFPGAPVPKKVKKAPDEKVEYGVLARIIGSGMTTGIVATVIVAVGIYAAIYFIFLREEEAPIVTATPTPTQSGSPVEINELDNIFRAITVVTFNMPTDKSASLPELKSFIERESLSTKEFKRVNLVIQGYDKPILTNILDSLAVRYPTPLVDYIKEGQMTLLYGQEESFNNPAPGNRMVLIAEVKNLDQTRELMRAWELTMAGDLKDLFGIDPAREATESFVDNERQGIMIRYQNFPYPDKSIDYAIVTSLTGRYYLVLTNSRESMFSPVDKIRGL